MPEHGHGHRPPPDTSTRLEESDLSIGGILKGVVGYFIFTIAVGAVVFVSMNVLGYSHPSGPVPPDRIPTQPNPLLQNNITAKTDIWNLRTYEDKLLHSTSYVDQQHGIVRVPVDQALDEMAQKGPDALNIVPAAQQTNTPGPGPGGGPAPANGAPSDTGSAQTASPSDGQLERSVGRTAFPSLGGQPAAPQPRSGPGLGTPGGAPTG